MKGIIGSIGFILLASPAFACTAPTASGSMPIGLGQSVVMNGSAASPLTVRVWYRNGVAVDTAISLCVYDAGSYHYEDYLYDMTTHQIFYQCTSPASIATVITSPAYIYGADTLCAGDSTVLSCTISGGYWSSLSPSVASIDAVTGELAGHSFGRAVIRYTVPKPCPSAQDYIVEDSVFVKSLDTSVQLIGHSFVANAMPPATYQWIDCATGAFIKDDTSRIFVPKASGSYAVIINKDGCRDTSACTSFFPASIGEDTFAPTVFLIYPQPASEGFTIRLAAHHAKARMSVMDMQGRKMREYILLEKETNIHAALPSGIYIVELEQDGQRVFRRLVIE